MALEEASGETGRNLGIHASGTLKMGCCLSVEKASTDTLVTHASYVKQVQERGPVQSPSTRFRVHVRVQALAHAHPRPVGTRSSPFIT